MYKLDEKDKKILYQLDVNSRQPVSVIARKTKLTKDVVNYRIKKLLEEGVIMKFLAVFDTSKLGYTLYKIFLRLQNANKKKEEEIIDYLKNHSNVQWVVSTDGMFDILFNVFVKDTIELDNILNDLQSKYGSFIAERQMLVMLKTNIFYRDYLIGRSSEVRKPIHFGAHSEKVKIDDTDRKILRLLGDDGRMPLVEIANKLKISADSARIRIKKLENSGIIQNYVLVLDNSKIGQSDYKILLKTQNMTEERKKDFFVYCKSQPNIWFFDIALGIFDLEINAEVEDITKFREIISEIKEKFSDIIKEYYILNMWKVYKFNFYPMEV